ncbi:DUF6221 family protein [Streptomyces cyaneofuscatus]|uniref:DUF6221 family protein n=1 Tax=Streptomyces cyaneofuscatus TaxID=66883 RepID=UPI0036801ABF
MTAQGEDILVFLEQAITAREEAARAVGFDTIETGDYLWGAKYLVLRRGDETKAAPEMDGSLADHIALHDPESVLRGCAADRKALALYSETVVIRDKSAALLRDAQDRSVHPAPSVLDDWNRANREAAIMLPLIQLLAEGYGWTEGER